MSNKGSKDAGSVPLLRAREAVERTLGEIERLRKEVLKAEDQNTELEELLSGVTDGKRSPSDMIQRLHLLEDENRDLRERIFEGRTSVDRLLARIQFLEDQR